MQATCPLCGADSACCQPSQGGDINACWCNQEKLDLQSLNAALNKLPEEVRQGCICQRCAENFKKAS